MLKKYLLKNIEHQIIQNLLLKTNYLILYYNKQNLCLLQPNNLYFKKIYITKHFKIQTPLFALFFKTLKDLFDNLLKNKNIILIKIKRFFIAYKYLTHFLIYENFLHIFLKICKKLLVKIKTLINFFI